MRKKAKQKKPILLDFLIIGAQKSGSTFVHKCLEEHPQVFMPSGEVPFFENPDYQTADFSQLTVLFKGATDQQILGIKRPNYLHKPECPERIHRHFPDAKLIAVLRNPVDRAISGYFHEMKNGFIPVKLPEKGMLQLLDGKYKDLYPRSKEIIDFGFYYRHLRRYLKYFSRKQILILFFDDLVNNPLKSIKQAYKFLNIDSQYIPTSLNSKPQAGIYSLVRLKFQNLRNPFLYTYNQDRTRLYEKQQTALDRLVIKVINVIDRLLLLPVFGNSKPKFSHALKQRIFKIYQKDINSLEGLLRLRLTQWKPAQNRQNKTQK
jgi:hypothetical protein